MNTSIIKGTLSEKDAYTRHELPRFEQIITSLLTQISRGLESINKALESEVTITVKTQTFTISPQNLAKYAPEQIAEARKIAEKLETALQEIGYTPAQSNATPPTALQGAQVIEASSQIKGQPPLKTATISALP